MSIATWEFESPPLHLFAEIAQLVEHNLAKVGVASSSLVFRSRSLEWWNGRHEGLKILWAEMSVRVRVSLRAHHSMLICFLTSQLFLFLSKFSLKIFNLYIILMGYPVRWGVQNP